MTTQPSTARRGNPKQASRGAACNRAKDALSAALDGMLDLEITTQGQRKLELLAEVTGIPVSEMRRRLDVATIDELERWTELVKGKLEKQ